jgi:hypothetical protein
MNSQHLCCCKQRGHVDCALVPSLHRRHPHRTAKNKRDCISIEYDGQAAAVRTLPAGSGGWRPAAAPPAASPAKGIPHIQEILAIAHCSIVHGMDCFDW